MRAISFQKIGIIILKSHLSKHTFSIIFTMYILGTLQAFDHTHFFYLKNIKYLVSWYDVEAILNQGKITTIPVKVANQFDNGFLISQADVLLKLLLFWPLFKMDRVLSEKYVSFYRPLGDRTTILIVVYSTCFSFVHFREIPSEPQKSTEKNPWSKQQSKWQCDLPKVYQQNILP